MATLCTGNSYDLSQCNAANPGNKEYLYVKLTDSALRAIEEYQKNQNTLSAPTIQFLGNEGILSFPSATSGCEQKFSFQIQEIDLQGPQGSFECVQQNSQKQLTTLGTLPYKMRIQANDDVYESTKHKMTKETENIKNKCTREIKPNRTDIGRTVKLKPGANRYPTIPTSSLHQQQKRDPYSSTSSNNNFNSLSSSSSVSASSSSSISTTTTLGNSNGNVPANAASAAATNLSSNIISNRDHHHYLSGAASVTSSSATATTTLPPCPTISNKSSSLATNQYHNSSSTNSSSSATSNHLNSSSNMNSISSGNGLVPSRVTTTTTTNNPSSNRNQSRSNPAIMKRSLRERLIHLLALRPYKKPELYAKITNDGIRNNEKNCIAIILKQISYIRDNTYHLYRHIWNDVQEDWPFYNEQERQSLKRRKPQNLTPPVSSDGGSSTSGQSPTSTHNGSPPPAVNRPPLKSSDMSQFDGPVSKKQRISHYRKAEVVNHDTIRSNVTPNAQESEDSGLSLSYSVLAQDVANRISSSAALDGHHGGHGMQHHLDDDHHMEQNFNDGESSEYVGDSNEFGNFSRITTVEQRRRYKTEFDNDFQEYRGLHSKINDVTARFQRLENELRNEEHNDRRYREIQKQILKEYENTKERRFQAQKRRFDYLHRKLSYIKQLVHEFDTSIAARMAQESY